MEMVGVMEMFAKTIFLINLESLDKFIEIDETNTLAIANLTFKNFERNNSWLFFTSGRELKM